MCSLGFCCCSVTKPCPTLCDPFNCRTPVFPVLHYLSEFAQTHVHWVIDAIQPSEPLSPPSPPALNLSQHQSFQWVDCSHQVAKVLELQLQHQSFPWIFRVDFLLGLTGFILDFFFSLKFYICLQGTHAPSSQHSNSEAPLILLLSPHHHTSVDHCKPWKAITRKLAEKKYEKRFIHSFNKWYWKPTMCKAI